MAALTGQDPKNSYEQLLHVDRDGGGNSTTPVSVKDGDNGTTFALELATDKIRVLDPTSGNRVQIEHGSGGEGCIRLNADDGNDVYIWLHFNGVGYEIRIDPTKP